MLCTFLGSVTGVPSKHIPWGPRNKKQLRGPKASSPYAFRGSFLSLHQQWLHLLQAAANQLLGRALKSLHWKQNSERIALCRAGVLPCLYKPYPMPVSSYIQETSSHPHVMKGYVCSGAQEFLPHLCQECSIRSQGIWHTSKDQIVLRAPHVGLHQLTICEVICPEILFPCRHLQEIRL